MRNTTRTRPRTAAFALATLMLAFLIAPADARRDDVDAQRSAAKRAAVAAARGQVTRAQEQLRAADERVRAAWRADPDNARAEAELAAAQAELDQAAAPVIARLRGSNAEYQAILRDEDTATRRLGVEQRRTVDGDPASTRPTTTRPAGAAGPENATATDPASPALNVPVPSDAQVTAAVDKLDVRTRRRELEQQAIAADPATAAARVRVDTASANLKSLRARLEAGLLNDPDYRAARDALAAARAELARAAGAN